MKSMSLTNYPLEEECNLTWVAIPALNFEMTVYFVHTLILVQDSSCKNKLLCFIQ